MWCRSHILAWACEGGGVVGAAIRLSFAECVNCRLTLSWQDTVRLPWWTFGLSLLMSMHASTANLQTILHAQFVHYTGPQQGLAAGRRVYDSCGGATAPARLLYLWT